MAGQVVGLSLSDEDLELDAVWIQTTSSAGSPSAEPSRLGVWASFSQLLRWRASHMTAPVASTAAPLTTEPMGSDSARTAQPVIPTI